MAKKPRYTMDDVERWESVDDEFFPPLIKKLRGDPNHQAISQGHGLCSYQLKRRAMAMSAIARGKYTLALGYLAVGCEAVCLMYERYEAGEDISPEFLSAGTWMELLLAHASRDKAVVERLCRLYDEKYFDDPATRSVEESKYIGRIIKALTEGRVDDARQTLGEPSPKIERMFRGYLECLTAIANGDQEGLEEALGFAADAWEKYSRRVWPGLPQSVCFIHGVGLIRLAEHVWGRPVVPEIDHIPMGLLADIRPEKVELGF